MTSWSHSAGRRATATLPSSRVRVYERPDLPGRIFLSRGWVLTASGRPVETVLPEGTTREGAALLADLTATERRRALLEGRNAMGEPKRTTLSTLLAAYHDSETSGRWSARTLEDKDRFRIFWETELAEDPVVETLTRAVVERIAQRAAQRAKWGPRTERKALEYLRAATRWGYLKAELLDTNPFRGGFTLPDYEPETQELIYSLQDAALLCRPHPEVDWRVTLACSIAWDTGRRISAISALRSEDVVAGEDRLYLRFRREYDKGRREALVPISEETAFLIAETLTRDLVEEWSWLFPEGRLDYDDPRDKPIGRKALETLLHNAEAVLGIPSIPGRGFHGLKRAHVTVSMEISSGDTALVGDVTGNLDADLIRRVYRRQSRERMARQVDLIREALPPATSPLDTED